jgi:hypothetical protein
MIQCEEKPFERNGVGFARFGVESCFAVFDCVSGQCVALGWLGRAVLRNGTSPGANVDAGGVGDGSRRNRSKHGHDELLPVFEWRRRVGDEV